MIQKIGVIGAGQMGNGIAHVCAMNGFEVRLLDANPDSLAKALATIAGNMDRQIKIIRAKPLSERPPRTFEPRENAKEEVKPRAPRAPRGAPRENRPPRVEGDRPPRQEGDRPPRKEGDRPPRREGDRP
jgi:hypothetical protein